MGQTQTKPRKKGDSRADPDKRGMINEWDGTKWGPAIAPYKSSPVPYNSPLRSGRMQPVKVPTAAPGKPKIKDQLNWRAPFGIKPPQSLRPNTPGAAPPPPTPNTTSPAVGRNRINVTQPLGTTRPFPEMPSSTATGTSTAVKPAVLSPVAAKKSTAKGTAAAKTKALEPLALKRETGIPTMSSAPVPDSAMKVDRPDFDPLYKAGKDSSDKYFETHTKNGRNKFDWDKAGTAANAIAPFASNIINSFRRPGKLKLPHLDSEIGGGRHINADNSRYMVEQGIRGSNRWAERNLDENSTTSVQQANLATRANQLGDINEKERNANIMIDNAGRETDARIRAGNNAKMDAYDMGNTDRTNAIQREGSANWANAADKYIGIQNEKAKQALEYRKQNILAKTDNNRVLQRVLEGEPGYSPTIKYPDNTPATIKKADWNAGAANSPDPTEPDDDLTVKKYRDHRKKAMGGSIRQFNTKRMMAALR